MIIKRPTWGVFFAMNAIWANFVQYDDLKKLTSENPVYIIKLSVFSKTGC